MLAAMSAARVSPGVELALVIERVWVGGRHDGRCDGYDGFVLFLDLGMIEGMDSVINYLDNIEVHITCCFKVSCHELILAGEALAG